MSDKRGAENKKRRGNTNDKRSRAERNIRWIEKYCCAPDGRDVGKPIVLRDFQRDIQTGETIDLAKKRLGWALTAFKVGVDKIVNRKSLMRDLADVGKVA